jgi:Cdc6-like AAA superfamily ATPase
MPRQSFTHNSPSGTQKNEIAYTFSEEVDQGLREAILPGRFGSWFPRESASLYVHKRRWEATELSKVTAYQYEYLLHSRYWPGHNSNYPLLIIQGPEGIGKTTFLKFYFDCYLPNYLLFMDPQATDQEIEQWSRNYRSSHVVLYSDLRYGRSREDVKRRMATDFDDQISRDDRFKDLTIRDAYAMWERALRWNDPLHAMKTQSDVDRREYRRRIIEEHLATVWQIERTVEEKLWYLAQRKVNGKREFYVTLILDNLDQLPEDIQEHVLDTVLQWLGKTTHHQSNEEEDRSYDINLWKVIVPLRPETRAMLSHKLEPIERTRII